jgi:hypothetical protein
LTQWTEAQAADVHRFWEVYDPRYGEIIEALSERLQAEPQMGPLLPSITADDTTGQTRDIRRAALVDGAWNCRTACSFPHRGHD